MDIMSHSYQLFSIIVFVVCSSVFVWCYFDCVREQKASKAEQGWKPNYQMPKNQEKVKCKYIYPQNI